MSEYPWWIRVVFGFLVVRGIMWGGSYTYWRRQWRERKRGRYLPPN